MYYEAINYAALNIAKFTPISKSALSVFIALASCCNTAGSSDKCFPSRARLAQLTGLHIDTVDDVLHRLRDAGIITWTTKRNAPNAYKFHLPGNGRRRNHLTSPRNLSHFQIPSLEDVLTYANNNGIPGEFALAIYNQETSEEWRDLTGSKIRDWQKYLSGAYALYKQKSTTKQRASGR